MLAVKSHKHVVKLIDHLYVWEPSNNEDLHLYIVMEKIRGLNLEHLNEINLKIAKEPFAIQEKKNICFEILK